MIQKFKIKKIIKIIRLTLRNPMKEASLVKGGHLQVTILQ